MKRLALAFLAVSCLMSAADPKRPLVVGSPEPPPPFRTRRVYEKVTLTQPVYVTSHAQHDRLFVVELRGMIHTLRDDKSASFLTEKDLQFYGMTFHPRYAVNRQVFVFANGQFAPKKKSNRIYRYTAAGDPPVADPKSRTLVIEWESNGHDGGDLAFGPDGMLYISAGDGTTDSDENNTGQDLRDLNSGIIRDYQKRTTGTLGVRSTQPLAYELRRSRPLHRRCRPGLVGNGLSRQTRRKLRLEHPRRHCCVSSAAGQGTGRLCRSAHSAPPFRITFADWRPCLSR
ncbi:MAG: hypothetical protein EBV06_05435 [Planctomycetia bacterium]|nr:hypothetical protein [Planctomycetia bacterium]